jgi:hypothetical protein
MIQLVDQRSDLGYIILKPNWRDTMNIIDIPTEQTTALTDLLMGLLVIVLFLFINRMRSSTNTPKIFIWLCVFGFLGFASLVGTVAHGFAMSHELNFWLWQPINLALGMVIAMFVVGTTFDIWGESIYRRILLPMVGVAVIFYAITVIIPGTFLTFVAYEAVAMLFALGGYIFLALIGKLKGAWWMVAGILITMIAAVIQAVGKDGIFIFWGLDHNGVFHLIQMFGVLGLTIGLH